MQVLQSIPLSHQYSKHFSASMYHLRAPKLLLFVAGSQSGSSLKLMASTSQISAHLLHPLQNWVTPKSIGFSGVRGRSVKTLKRRTLGPYSGVMIRPCLPSYPSPASIAIGTLSPTLFPAGIAVYPRFLMNSARVAETKAI